MELLETRVDRLDILVPEDYDHGITINFTYPVQLYKDDEGKTILTFGMPEEHIDALYEGYKELVKTEEENETVEQE